MGKGARDKHSSFLRKLANYGRKKCYNIVPRTITELDPDPDLVNHFSPQNFVRQMTKKHFNQLFVTENKV
jgi:hypothetical protein